MEEDEEHVAFVMYTRLVLMFYAGQFNEATITRRDTFLWNRGKEEYVSDVVTREEVLSCSITGDRCPENDNIYSFSSSSN